MYDLADVYAHFHDMELYEYGSVMSLAVNKPSELKNLQPTKRFNVEEERLPGMLRIPKKTEHAR